MFCFVKYTLIPDELEMVLVNINPELLRWARERSDVTEAFLAEKVHKNYPKWERGEAKPTFKQLAQVSKKTHTAIGYFFLEEPPEEKIPISDFRTFGGKRAMKASVNLLDTIYLCKLRQKWYRDHVIFNGGHKLPFVGSAKLSDNAVDVGKNIRKKLGLNTHKSIHKSKQGGGWENALGDFAKKIEHIGVLAMLSSIVKNNSHRGLDPKEFRGFALVDNYAPLVFINKADAKAAQMFTMAHELAHIWLGVSSLTDSGMEASKYRKGSREEVWCNQVAAEVLVPLQEFKESLPDKASFRNDQLPKLVQRSVSQYKVSKLVVLRRLLDADFLTGPQFKKEYGKAENDYKNTSSSGDDAHFFNIHTMINRTSRRFATALVNDTIAGHTLYHEAFQLLGTSNIDTFHKMADNL